MLRISVTPTAADTATLHLEGHLAGAWIAELHSACDRLLGDGRHVTLDLGDVSLIERPGFDLLASLSRRDVVFARCSPFQGEQLRRAVEIDLQTTTTTHELA